MKSTEIQMRDPFVLVLKEEGSYFLYGTTDKNCWSGKATGFDAYSSMDLENWEGPFTVFTPGSDFWADQNFWAPEVYLYNGRYYMFASFKADGVCRGTQILVSDSPLGPFVPKSPEPVTPRGWECHDGTLYLDNNSEPWMVFSHEWLQLLDGEICAVRLSEEMDRAVSDPYFLFKASEAAWSSAFRNASGEKECQNTDGPFIYTTENGSLLMLWSSNGSKGYTTTGVSKSESGDILGPWIHEEKPLYTKNGGHGMIFKTFDGKLKLTMHIKKYINDNTTIDIPVFVDIIEQNGSLVIQ